MWERAEIGEVRGPDCRNQMAEKSRQPADMSSGASPLELAHAAIAEAARSTSAKQVEREYFNLFIVLWRGSCPRAGR